MASTCVTPGHTGEHQVGLYMYPGGTEKRYNGRWAVERAIAWAEGLDDAQDDIALVKPLLDRPVFQGLYVYVTDEERDALYRLLDAAQDYWDMCDYANDYSDEEERMLGLLSQQRFLTGYTVCWKKEN